MEKIVDTYLKEILGKTDFNLSLRFEDTPEKRLQGLIDSHKRLRKWNAAQTEKERKYSRLQRLIKRLFDI